MTKEVSYRCDICGLLYHTEIDLKIISHDSLLHVCDLHDKSLIRWIKRETKQFEWSGVD